LAKGKQNKPVNGNRTTHADNEKKDRRSTNICQNTDDESTSNERIFLINDDQRFGARHAPSYRSGVVHRRLNGSFQFGGRLVIRSVPTCWSKPNRRPFRHFYFAAEHIYFAAEHITGIER
jgi:hypothetical protein